MSGPVHSYILPELCSAASLRGGIAVVIDLLRASTTITHALASGADRLIAFAKPAGAVAARPQLPHGSTVLGGERGGVRIDGFDLGNSPAEYTPQRVAGKTVLFTTTNGTRAALHAAAADQILFGCLANLSALVRHIGVGDRPIHILCAGTDGLVSQEDCLCAGAIIDGLCAAGRPLDSDDQALMMRTLWRSVAGSPDRILDVLLASSGGRNLVPLGFKADVELCARCDTTSVIPRMDSRTRIITSVGV